MNKQLKQAYQNEFNRLKEQANIQRKTWDGTFTKPIQKQYKISLCTTIMDRLPDLQQTLPQNIKDNANYPNVEFVILDYNSRKHNVGEWIKTSMFDLVKSGKVVYGRTEEPEFYSMTISRNLAFRLASGDIVNNVDADAYTKPSFATFINKLANQKPHKAIFSKSHRQLLRGRVGFFKDEFINDLGGYDEQIEDYGYDDWDIVNRACKLGFTIMPFGGKYHDKCNKLKHQTENMKEKDYKYTELRNKIYSLEQLLAGNLKANTQKGLTTHKIIKNFNEQHS